MKSSWHAHDVVDGWRLERRLGAGGNGEVWVAERAGTTAALKLLKTEYLDAGSKRFMRFRDEARTQARLTTTHLGVLPLLDYSIPTDPGPGTPAWLATPIATTVKEALEGAELLDAVGAVLAVAETLAALHAEGVSHRDIKPSNLYQFEGRWVVGDLGLVDFPDKDSVTETGERLGPWNYLAPEMLDEAKKADGAKADVYSLAKTLWVLATEQSKPPPGEQRADNLQLGIGAYRPHPRAGQLNLLIERCTRHDPAARPTMAEAAAELRAWLATPVERSRPDLSDLLDRIRAQAEPAVRSQQERQRQLKEAEGLFSRLHGRVQAIGFELARTGLCDGTPEELDSQGGFLFAYRLSPGHLWARGWVVRAVKPGLPAPWSPQGGSWVELACCVGVGLRADATVHLRGEHQVNSDHDRQCVGSWEATAPVGSALQDQLVIDLFNRLGDSLPAALEEFSRQVGADGRPPSARGSSS